MKDYKEELIHILEDSTQSKGQERLGLMLESGQKMRTTTKILREDCPCQMVEAMIVCISTDKGKEVLRVWLQRNGKEGILGVEQ